MATAIAKDKKAKHEEWTRSKVERASKDEFSVISQKTKDTSLYINLLNTTDNLMYALRMNVGHKPHLTIDVLMDFIERQDRAAQDLNRINADLCKALGREYRPPRGFKDPNKVSQVSAEPTAKV